ncbi:hypothetical protein C440_13314 [Haloferax mucosum ATCC BAA-1512]|uniref:Uncharacterized protein n=1 Tax=Haloferax mucosum ATCC BAA-1512 TaxID=662479 RepID=M0I3C2_9EURY|nr:hypothetical protein [Haloferax mucosum]ELZ91295.1 hypothetical protein C440_13314 [Haloferax mucosum ATCC BAA-1512]
MVPLQFGFPGFGVLLVSVAVPVLLGFALAYLVYNDAEKRGDENAVLWALGVGVLTLTTFFGGLLVVGVYVWQRE